MRSSAPLPEMPQWLLFTLRVRFCMPPASLHSPGGAAKGCVPAWRVPCAGLRVHAVRSGRGAAPRPEAAGPGPGQELPANAAQGRCLLPRPQYRASGLETSQPAHQCLRPTQDSRLWPGPGPLPRWQLPLHTPGGHQEITELPDYNKISFKDQAPMPLGELLPDAPPQALDLLGHFLRYPPRQRIAASQARHTSEEKPGPVAYRRHMLGGVMRTQGCYRGLATSCPAFLTPLGLGAPPHPRTCALLPLPGSCTTAAGVYAPFPGAHCPTALGSLQRLLAPAHGVGGCPEGAYAWSLLPPLLGSTAQTLSTRWESSGQRG
ncbi:uncharacterized protein [Manis javanica]|uniref:uncharacterized protein isoform X7 n=1 Tax=Manis javanica TaxID=9974 RepID=UPI003C6D2F37